MILRASTRSRHGWLRSAATLLVLLSGWFGNAHAVDDGIVLLASRSGASSVSLAWSGGSAPFDVYRSASPGALFNAGSQLGEASSAVWLDTPPAGTLFCYGVKNVPDDERIATARSQPDGPVNVGLAGSFVTYVKPAVGTEGPGFFVQSTQLGPAIFVAVNPATLPDPPVAGDFVSFTITSMGTVGSLRQALSVAGYARLSSGNSLNGLVQDVSAASDLVFNVGAYESELISVNGTIVEAFHAAGAGFVSARITTLALPAADPNLQFRTTTAVPDLLDLVSGCQVSVTKTALWRFNAAAQPMAFNVAEVVPSSCPVPQVTVATALSATTVAVDFDRRIDPASVNPSGSQFQFDNGLVATAASVSARRVTVTTNAQVAAAAYTVTVSGTVTDTLGSGVNPAVNSASFAGYFVTAGLLINELNPNITGSKDLVELLVVSAGSTNGVRLEQAIGTPVVLATLPDMPVAVGDIIVIHLAPGMGEGPASETVTTNQYAAAVYSNNYDTAWDVNGGATGLTFTDRVILLRKSTGTILDAVPFVNLAGSPISAFPADLQTIQASGDWLPADCGGALCTNVSTPSARDVSVNWNGVGVSKTGSSVQRFPGVDSNSNSSWKPAGPQTFGAPNPP